jgi:hypothetical protein
LFCWEPPAIRTRASRSDSTVRVLTLVSPSEARKRHGVDWMLRALHAQPELSEKFTTSLLHLTPTDRDQGILKEVTDDAPEHPITRIP